VSRLTTSLRSIAAGVAWIALLGIAAFASIDSSATTAQAALAHANLAPRLFETSLGCMACHNGLTTSSGEDVSIGSAWRGSMMANSSRDPYWQASVRREMLDHPERGLEIEDSCSTCHMPMMRYQAKLDGGEGKVFAHLPIANGDQDASALAADGVSCTLCHQIANRQLGSPSSFNGGFTIEELPAGKRPVFGPYDIDGGRQQIMHSSAGYLPTRGDHIRSSELCATCHTLFTTTLGMDGKEIGRLPEQVPFLEWKHSAYSDRNSCQSCHMPAVAEPITIASVLGQTRERLARHDFRGGNFFMLGMLNRYRAELGVTALPQEMDASVRRAITHLERETARLTIEDTRRDGGQLTATVSLRNLTGHKFPTAYPSRRAWLHVTVRDRSGAVVFESGAVGHDGAIKGNDNDGDPSAFEPHYRVISRADQVQVYESIMVDAADRVTTGLLSALRYVKDNRLLPEGFDKQSASRDVAVHGDALEDANFIGGGDRVAYSIDVSKWTGPLEIEAELRFQPVGFRWARNLKGRDAEEIARFVSYYEAMANTSSVSVASAKTLVP
jgi:cytochrome c551/c552